MKYKRAAPDSNVPRAPIRRLSWMLLFAACSASDAKPLIEESDSSGVRIITIEAAPEDIPVWQLGSPIGGISGSAATEPGGHFLEEAVAAYWTEDGSILVVDAGSRFVHLYSADGRHRRSFGGEGAGPGEIGSVGTVSFSADTVFIFDLTDRNIEVFAAGTGFVRSVPAMNVTDGAVPSAAWRLGDGFITGYLNPVPGPSPGGAGVLRQQRTLDLVPTNGNRSPEIGYSLDAGYSGMTSFGDVRAPFSNSPFVHTRDTLVLVGSGVQFEAILLNRRLRPLRMIRWPALSKPVTSAEVDSLRSELFGPTPAARARRISDVMFSPELMPATRPVLGYALIDNVERLWFGSFEPPPRAVHQRLWYTLDSSGLPVGRLPLPARTQLVDVRGDTVLVIQRDEFDVTSVVAYPLIKSD